MHTDHLHFATHRPYCMDVVVPCMYTSQKRPCFQEFRPKIFLKLYFKVVFLGIYRKLIFPPSHGLLCQTCSSSKKHKNQQTKGYTHCTPPTQQHMSHCLAHREESPAESLEVLLKVPCLGKVGRSVRFSGGKRKKILLKTKEGKKERKRCFDESEK